MARYPCSNCGARPTGKLAGVYASWLDEKEQRNAWRLRYCAGCLTQLVGLLKAGALGDSSVLSACCMCASDCSTGYNETWLNLYPPKQSDRELVAITCPSCAATLRTALSDHGEPLPDRNAVAAATAEKQASVWDSIPW